jgi:hypothetical protein
VILDDLQSRYHRSTGECLELSYLRLGVMRDQQGRAYKDDLIKMAFLAHQLGAGGDKTFRDYLITLGLIEGVKTPQAVKAPQLSSEQIKQKARNTLARARERRCLKHSA